MFDFHKFIKGLEEDEEKSEMVKKYRNYFSEMLEQPLQEQNWYQDYIEKFKVKSYEVPSELENKSHASNLFWDWDLLMKLAAGSFSNDGILKFEINDDGKDQLPEFEINVTSGDQKVTKKVSELFDFQIIRLFEIYVEEQMTLQILIAEDEEQGKNNEKNAILTQRQFRSIRWDIIFDGKDPDDFFKPRVVSNTQDISKFTPFDFNKFLQNLKEDKQKIGTFEMYSKYFPDYINKPVKEQPWHINYISKFSDTPSYYVPKKLLNNYDWDLLLQLVAGSFSSNVDFGKKRNGSFELEIEVKSGVQTVVKTVSDLIDKQIDRLFSIYVEEQMNLAILIKEDEEEGKENETKAIQQQQKERHIRWSGLKTRLRMRELGLLD